MLNNVRKREGYFRKRNENSEIKINGNWNSRAKKNKIQDKIQK